MTIPFDTEQQRYHENARDLPEHRSVCNAPEGRALLVNSAKTRGMRNEASRVQTFVGNSTYWPANRIRASPEEIANAGMYYLGERDRVKCWYCNGGLQNWTGDDDPWEEHAKWFPMCEFVLQQKGPDYVHRTVARFPNLRRPTLYNPAEGRSAAQVLRVAQSGPDRQSTPASDPIVIEEDASSPEKRSTINVLLCCVFQKNH